VEENSAGHGRYVTDQDVRCFCTITGLDCLPMLMKASYVRPVLGSRRSAAPVLLVVNLFSRRANPLPPRRNSLALRGLGALSVLAVALIDASASASADVLGGFRRPCVPGGHACCRLQGLQRGAGIAGGVLLRCCAIRW
jgi:hypothetical protein